MDGDDDNVWTEHDEMTLEMALEAHPIGTHNRLQQILNYFPLNKRVLAETHYFARMGLDGFDNVQMDEELHDFALEDQLNIEELPQLLEDLEQEQPEQHQNIPPPQHHNPPNPPPPQHIQMDAELHDFALEDQINFEELPQLLEDLEQEQPEQHQNIPPQHHNPPNPPLQHIQMRDGAWTDEEKALFLQGLHHFGLGRWAQIAAIFVRSRTATQVRTHSRNAEYAQLMVQLNNQIPQDEPPPQMQQGPWTPEENAAFQQGLIEVGAGQWTRIAHDYVRTRTPDQAKSHFHTAAYAGYINNN